MFILSAYSWKYESEASMIQLESELEVSRSLLNGLIQDQDVLI